MLLQQPAGQPVAFLTGPILPLDERDQTILAILTEHLIEGLVGLAVKRFA